MRTFRCMYINYFNRLTFLGRVYTKLQKEHFLGEFKDYKPRRKPGN